MCSYAAFFQCREALLKKAAHHSTTSAVVNLGLTRELVIFEHLFRHKTNII